MKKIRWFHRNLHGICKLRLFNRFLILIWCIFLHFNLDRIRNIDMNVILLKVIIEKGVPFVLNESILLFFIFKLNFVICCVLYKLIMKLLYQFLKILFDSVKFGNLFVKFLWGLLDLTKFWLLKCFLKVCWHCNIRGDYSRPVCVLFPLRRMDLFQLGNMLYLWLFEHIRNHMNLSVLKITQFHRSICLVLNQLFMTAQ